MFFLKKIQKTTKRAIIRIADRSFAEKADWSRRAEQPKIAQKFDIYFRFWNLKFAKKSAVYPYVFF